MNFLNQDQAELNLQYVPPGYSQKWGLMEQSDMYKNCKHIQVTKYKICVTWVDTDHLISYSLETN